MATALQKFLDTNSFEEIASFFNKMNVKVKVLPEEDLYVVYPCKNAKAENENDEEILKQCNYTFIQKSTNKIVHYFTQIDEIYKNIDDVLNYAINSKNQYKLMLRFEGTLIKVYFHNGVWNIGTNKHTNAALSFWNSNKSFKELFHECIINEYDTFDDYLKTLKKDYCYSYVLQHPENNLCIKTSDHVVHLINKVNLTLMHEILNENLCFAYEETNEKFKKIKNKNLNTSDNYVLYLYTNKKLSRVVVESEQFIHLKNLYGNCKDIRLRYISCLNDSEMKKTIRNFFPYYKDDYDEIDSSFDLNALDIYISYYNIHVKKDKQIKVSGIYKDILYKIHNKFLTTKQAIELEDIKEVLITNYSTNSLSKILNVNIQIK